MKPLRSRSPTPSRPGRAGTVPVTPSRRDTRRVVTMTAGPGALPPGHDFYGAPRGARESWCRWRHSAAGAGPLVTARAAAADSDGKPEPEVRYLRRGARQP
jgi:hypothetical protein